MSSISYGRIGTILHIMIIEYLNNHTITIVGIVVGIVDIIIINKFD